MPPKKKLPLLDKGDILNNKWEILDHIATGGMAEIYRARQIKLERQVAVKILSQEFLASIEEDEDEMQSVLDRFFREVRAMAQVRHPNVLQVYDQDRAEITIKEAVHSVEYIAMEYIAGPNLRSTMPAEGLEREGDDKIKKWIRNYFIPVLNGVEAIHALDIVHRDLKPENILIDGFTPKITDFGLAGGARWRRVTQSYHIFGTAPYQAPEQFVDMAETDGRADIYSLGKILLEAIAGTLTKETAYVFKTAQLKDPETPLLKKLDRTIRQATAENLSERISTVQVLRQELLDILGEDVPSAGAGAQAVDHKTRKRNQRIFVGFLVVAFLASILIHIFYHREQSVPPSPDTRPTVTETAPPAPSETSAAPQIQPPVSAETSSRARARDGALMALIPGGELTMPEGEATQAEKNITVAPFYMDETEVTNHQYVIFLNSVRSRIKVEGEVVKSGAEIWLLLGPVSKGYEPIVFRNDAFEIQDPTFASNPVVRVTGYGATAYARYYGRRLPTRSEWLYVQEHGAIKEQAPPVEEPDLRDMMAEMMRKSAPSTAPQQPKEPNRIAPVSLFLADKFGIRGLTANAREWVRLDGEKEEQYMVFPTAVSRNPWEAFDNVGFRCAVGVSVLSDAK